jgi:hypothetical protein
VRKRKKRRPATEVLPAERRIRLPSFAVGAGLLLALWALLWWLSAGTRSGPYWLILCGMLTTAIAVIWLYRSAFADGVEHLNFLTHNSPVLTVRVLLLLCELVFVPFFSVVYLILFFHNAWKPFLIEILGMGCRSQVLFWCWGDVF